MIRDLSASDLLKIFSVSEFAKQASMIKCARQLAFADCFPTCHRRGNKIPVVFSSQEVELAKQIEKRPFRTKIYFVTELMKSEREEIFSDSVYSYS